MPTSHSVLCTDFYVNQKLALKLDLPTGRETVLDMFDRIRKELPEMKRFKRFEGELALESMGVDAEYSWMAMRQTSIRSGWVNPDSLEVAYKLHRFILEIAPYYLSISPIDVDYLELVFGFDIQAGMNRNQIVMEALLADSPLASLIDGDREKVIDAQPFLGFSLSQNCDLQAFVEIKTRTGTAEIASGNYEDEPISVYLTARRHGPLTTMDQINETFGMLAGHVERLAEDRVIPHVVMPIREAILSYPG
ncbi:MAG: hypothetical protein O7G85_09175 [Planctomycetota bacterium]|nr:hypothetical protein [Planctomycetota bacterium]